VKGQEGREGKDIEFTNKIITSYREAKYYEEILLFAGEKQLVQSKQGITHQYDTRMRKQPHHNYP
tara:strand:- start:557 stop:751 length:195 start_codon:yes stop_codon:yes gene_type:complete